MKAISNYKKTRRRKRNWKPLFWIFLTLILLVGAGYSIFFSPLFKIKNINAQGTEKIPNNDILSLINQELGSFYFRYIPKNNFYLISEASLLHILKEKFPGAKTIEVSKKFPASLMVALKDREKVLTYCKQIEQQPVMAEGEAAENATGTKSVLEPILQLSNGQAKCFYIDNEGIVFEEAPEIYGGTMVVLKDVSNREIKIGDKTVDNNVISFIINAQKSLYEKVNISLLYFQINSFPTIDVIAQTAEGWQIIFDITRQPEAQVIALEKILQEKIKEQRDHLEYIDLRVENRVYYKMKN